MSPQKKEFIRNIFILTILTLITFLPCVWNGFTTWDDPAQNAIIKSLSWNSFIKTLTGFTMGSYTPLTLLSYALEFHFVQLHPFLYHLDNVLLHIIVNVLVYLLILRIDGRHGVALITALIFAVNPLRVEPVAWINGRKDLLCSVFYLSALLMHIKWIVSSQKKYFWTGFLSFLLALLSKTQALSLPFAFLALDYFFKHKIEKDDFIRKIPFFILTAIFVMVSLHSSPQTFSEVLPTSFNVFEKFFLINFAFFLYTFLSIFSVKTSFFYPYPGQINSAFPFFIYLLPLFNAGLFYSLIRFRQKNRFVFLAGVLFVISLAPSLAGIGHEGYFISERDLYLPSVWFLFGLIRLCEGIKLKIPPLSAYATPLAVIMAAFFALLSFGKCFIWKNDLSLWGTVIDTFPNSSVAYMYRGEKFREFGLLDLAIKDLNQAVDLNPGDTKTLYNRALTYIDLNQHSLAIPDFNKILAANPHNSVARFFRAVCYKETQKYNEAMDDLNILARDPETNIQTVKDNIAELKDLLNKTKS
jgi:tetratricopeptide (TPR) repeat protein